jgi:hypothetical protein
MPPADNTALNTMSGGDTIATDDVSGVKTQIVKAAFGVDGAMTRVAAGVGLPVAQQDVTATANITTQNLVPTGVATAGSACQTGALNGASMVCIQVTGTYTGSLTVQGTVDGSTWVTLQEAFGTTLNIGSGTTATNSIVPSATTGLFVANVAGLNKFRVTALGSVTGTATVSIQASLGHSPMTPLTGAYIIGSVVVTPGAGTFPTGFTCRTGLPGGSVNGQTVVPTTDKNSRVIVVHNGIREIITPVTQLVITADTTEKSLIGATAAVFHDLLEMTFANTSLTTGTQVDLRDSTGGTIRCSVWVPANATITKAWNTPLPQATVNTAWSAQCGASVASIVITGSYVSNN